MTRRTSTTWRGSARRGSSGWRSTPGTPIVFGVLTVDTLEQAHERIGGSEGHKGEEAARTAVEMVSVLRQVDASGTKAVTTGFRGAGSREVGR